MKCIRILFIIPVCLIFVGCAVPPSRQPLTEANKSSIEHQKLALNSDQVAVKADLGLQSQMPKTLPPSTPAAANDSASASNNGLLGALLVSAIDHSRGEKITQQMAPIKLALQKFPVMTSFKRELTTELKPIKWLKIDSSMASVGYTDQQKQMMLETSKDNTGMFIDLNYEMNKDFNVMYVSAHVLMEQPGGQNGKLKPIYENYFVFIDRLPGIKHREQALPIWTADHGKKLKEGLLEGGHALAKMIAMDVKNPNANLYKTLPAKAVKFQEEQNMWMKGKVVAKMGPMTIYRTNDGSLYAV